MRLKLANVYMTGTGGKVLTVNEHFLDVIMVHFLDGQLHSEPRALKVTSLICFNSLWTIKLRVVCLAEPEVEVEVIILELMACNFPS